MAELLFPLWGLVILVIREVRVNLKFYQRGSAAHPGAFNALSSFFFFKGRL